MASSSETDSPPVDALRQERYTYKKRKNAAHARRLFPEQCLPQSQADALLIAVYGFEQSAKPVQQSLI